MFENFLTGFSASMLLLFGLCFFQNFGLYDNLVVNGEVATIPIRIVCGSLGLLMIVSGIWLFDRPNDY